MVFYVKVGSLLLAALLALSFSLSSCKSLEQPDKMFFSSPLETVDGDGTAGQIDPALMNYLFARQMLSRARGGYGSPDTPNKRTYYKQCAFNAVSCFGKKK